MFFALHYLRALAAVLVVCFHAQEIVHIDAKFGSWHYLFAGGVDIFFVLSGFLMVYTTRKYSSSRLDWRSFLLSRVIRVGPIYWLLTILIGIAVVLHPSFSDRPIDLSVVIRSLIFLPSELGANTVQTTVLPVGWTLVYEMFFYVLFAACAAWSYRAGVWLLCLILALLSASHWHVDTFILRHYSNPILLEFGYGVLIGLLYRELFSRLDRSVFLPVLIVLTGLLMMGVGSIVDGPDLQHRYISCGVGAAFLVLGCVFLRLPRLALPSLLGDASYSIYLGHLYGLKYLGIKLLGIHSWFGLACIGVVSGVALYIGVEKPLSRFFGSFKGVAR